MRLICSLNECSLFERTSFSWKLFFCPNDLFHIITSSSSKCICCRVFAQRSFDLLTILYEEKPEDAMKIIVTECTVWDIDVMPLECAYDNVMLDFISHSCVQRSLNKIWYEDIGATLGDFWWVRYYYFSHYIITH